MKRNEEIKKIRKILKKWEESTITEHEIEKENPTEDIDVVNQANMIYIELQKYDHRIKLLNEIKHAIRKIDKGTYGLCEESGEEIDIERLKANPIARYSIETQKFFEETNKKRNF